MKRYLFGLFFVSVLAVFLVADAMAGQYKTLNTGGLGVGASISARSSPKNTGNAMEMETYEFVTAAGGGGYQCRITQNATGQNMNISLMGVNATVITSCATVVNGTCSTPCTGLTGNLKFQCLVATDAFSPVNASANYTMAVTRCSAAPSASSTPDEAGVTSY